MSTPDDHDADEFDAADGLDPADPSDPGEDPGALDEEGLFTGDTGTLPRAVRTVLVQLLKRRYVSAERHPRSWRVLVENQRALRARLNDVFLDLVVDQDHQVAYKQQAASRAGQQRFPTLLHDQPWSREETALLICLRRLARSRSATGEGAVFVDREELLQEVAHFRPLDSTNHVRDEQSAAAGVDSLVRQEVLLETGTENRYRVSPILEVLLPVDVVQRIAARLGARDAVAGGPA